MNAKLDRYIKYKGEKVAMTVTSINLPKDLHAWCVKNSVNVSAVTRDALEELMAKIEKAKGLEHGSKK